jgi:hypothetical protein
MTLYVHYRGRRLPGRPCACGIGLAYVVYDRRNGATAPLDPALDVSCWTDGGYQWGCGTSGAKQLAVAILRDYFRRHRVVSAALKAAVCLYYEAFTARVVAHLPARWELWPDAITEFLNRAVSEINGVKIDWDAWIASAQRRGLLCDGYPALPFLPEEVQ